MLRSKGTLALSVVIFTMFASSCTTSDPLKPNLQPIQVKEIVVTFDGSTCLYEGPLVIAAGEVTVTRNNLTNAIIDVDITHLAPGYTYEDLWNYIGESGEDVHLNLLEWAPSANSRPVVSDPDQKIYNFEAGSYVITCIEILQGKGAHHKGAAFWVE